MPIAGAIATAALALLPAAAGAVNLSSGFDASAESWRRAAIDVTVTPPSSVTLTHATTFSTVDWLGTGGNPGGRITYQEGNAPAPPQYRLWTFVTPAAWTGDWSANYGGLVSFDYRTNFDLSANISLTSAQVEIVDGSTRYVSTPPPVPAQDAWTSYAVPLHESFWSSCTSENACSDITKASFQAMLASTSPTKTIRIWATYTSTDGEQGDLDNASLTEDTTAPDAQIVTGPDGPTNDNTPTFTFNSSGGGFTSYGDADFFTAFECSLDQGTPNYDGCGTRPLGDDGSYTQSPPLADGTYTFRLKGSDWAGNEDPTPAVRTFVVDTRSPDAEITKRPKARIRTTRRSVRVRFEFGADEAADFTCKLDGKPPAPCTSPKTYRVGKGRHVFKLTATDAAGNAASATASFKVIRKR